MAMNWLYLLIRDFLNLILKIKIELQLNLNFRWNSYYLHNSETNKLLVDKVILFDELNHEVPKILQKNLKIFLEEPKINSSKNKLWVKEELTPGDFSFIYDFYETDFQFLKNHKSNFYS